MISKEEWLEKFTIHCDVFNARVSIAQCKNNRKRFENGEKEFKVCAECSNPEKGPNMNNYIQCDICENEYPTSCFDEDENGEIVRQCCYCQKKYYLGKYAKED